jgi:hypothetical protein
LKKLVFIFSFLSSSLCAQNFVPNAGFEIQDTCPTNEDQAQYAIGWNKCSGDNVIFIGNTTPDYFNSCAPPNGYGIPQSGLQYQPDIRNCGAYMGLCTQNIPSFNNYREQIGINLTQPLTIGQKYYLSFLTVMGGHKIGADYYDNPSNNIGLRLSTTSYNPSNPAPIDNFAHLRSVSILADTVNWVRITGSIIADSAYTYVMLGNFYDDANTDTALYNCSSCQNYYSYYLVDNICVSTDSLFSNGGIDSAPCTAFLPDFDSKEEINIYPNPSADFINIFFGESGWEELIITDLYGKLFCKEKLMGLTTINVNISSFKAGIYFLNMTNRNEKQIANKKIIKL